MGLDGQALDCLHWAIVQNRSRTMQPTSHLGMAFGVRGKPTYAGRPLKTGKKAYMCNKQVALMNGAQAQQTKCRFASG